LSRPSVAPSTFFVFAAILTFAIPLRTGDWPGWRGPPGVDYAPDHGERTLGSFGYDAVPEKKMCPLPKIHSVPRYLKGWLRDSKQVRFIDEP
jgi:hypothetical protein